MKDYLTIKNASETLIIIEKSKFISYCFPIKTEDEAQEFLKGIRKKHYDATHNVWAYILGEDMCIQRYSDDGEPSGTAGIPTLDIMRKIGVTDCLIVVSRYFGGVKLGAGGLVRAYSKSAKLAVLDAGIVKYKVYILISLKVDYSLIIKIQQAIKDRNFILKETIYTESVEFLIYIDPNVLYDINAYFTDVTNGLSFMEIIGEELIAMDLKEGVYGN
ncbi:MAG: YigZ family protein [Filifactoraceae bacterium]